MEIPMSDDVYMTVEYASKTTPDWGGLPDRVEYGHRFIIIVGSQRFPSNRLYETHEKAEKEGKYVMSLLKPMKKDQKDHLAQQDIEWEMSHAPTEK